MKIVNKITKDSEHAILTIRPGPGTGAGNGARVYNWRVI